MTSCIWLIEIVDRLARIKLSLFYLILILGLESIDLEPYARRHIRTSAILLILLESNRKFDSRFK